MDRTAIERIEQLAAQGPLNTDIRACVVPSGSEIKSLEHLMDVPTRMRRTYKTERLEDFCRYMRDEAIDATAVFVLPDGSGAEGVIDYGSHESPSWGDHKAVLRMKHTPEFAALQTACAKQLSQRDLTDWIEDWAHIITPVINEKDETVGKAIQSIRRVEIKATASRDHTEGDFKASRTSLEQIEAASKDGQLPELIKVRCQVYPCTDTRNISARLSLLTGADKPTFRLRIMGLDALMKAVAEEIESEIADRLQGVRTFIGSV